MAFIAWLYKAQNALHRWAEAARNAERRKLNKQMERDAQPVKVEAIVSLDEKTIADVATHYHQPNPTQESIKKATWAAFYAVAAYALVTAAMWCAMLQQNKIAKQSLEQGVRQWRSQQAPLLGIENNAISISRQIRFVWGPPQLPYPSIWVGPIVYVIKNVGGGVAFHEWDQVHVMPNPPDIPDKIIKGMCPTEKQGPRETNEGQFVMQGAEIRSETSETNMGPTPTQTHITSVLILVCISYEDRWNTVHHSRFLYDTSPSQERAITPNPAHPEWTYVPIGGLFLKSADTDYGENPN